MKIRNGFVSNSSSSSFIVALPSHPYSEENLGKMLKLSEPDQWKAEHVFKQVKESRIYGRGQIAVHLSYGTGWRGCPDYKLLYEPKPGLDGSTFDDLVAKAANKAAEEFWERNKLKPMYLFTFHDDSEEGNELEHGGTFNGVPHLTVSHH